MHFTNKMLFTVYSKYHFYLALFHFIAKHYAKKNNANKMFQMVIKDDVTFLIFSITSVKTSTIINKNRIVALNNITIFLVTFLKSQYKVKVEDDKWSINYLLDLYF